MMICQWCSLFIQRQYKRCYGSSIRQEHLAVENNTGAGDLIQQGRSYQWWTYLEKAVIDNTAPLPLSHIEPVSK